MMTLTHTPKNILPQAAFVPTLPFPARLCLRIFSLAVTCDP